MAWVILNFDLGIKGDYESLYRVLDDLGAQDAGNANCAFKYSFPSDKKDHSERFKIIAKLIEEEVEIKKGDRIYAIVLDSKSVPRGTFLFGRRQTPVWEGYGEKKEEDQLPF